MNLDYPRKNFFKVYISLIFFFSIIILYNKFLHPTDWTTSEWLINYHGGFIRRGLIGELLLQINQFINVNPRYLVYIFEILLLSSYYYLIINFFKKINFSPILILVIFSPLAFVYPVAEAETLARKEILLFCIYIIFLSSLILKNLKLTYFVIIILIPLMNLVWDGILFYMPFFIFSFINQNNNLKLKKLIYFLISFIPYLITTYILLHTRATEDSLLLMCEAIKEPCFGSMSFLDKPLSNNINYVVSRFKIEYLIRYSFIFIICFYPIFNLFKKNKKILFVQYVICVLPTFVLFYIGYDWGRYLNILYIFSLLTIIFFIKKNIIDVSKNSFNKFLVKIGKKKKFMLYGIFICYLFLWNPKAIMSDDVGSLPYIRIIDKIAEYIN
tara:strand:- start:249 stop:1403 length:1155 start_codon:yes stop_codon:yes gene_type:complete